MIAKIKELLSGKKVYLLVGLGAIVSIVQFSAGVDLGIPDLPQAQNIGELINQVYLFAIGAAARAAVAK